MKKMMTLLAALGAAGIACTATATSAQAGGWCPRAYTGVYYAPPPCCAVYGYYPSLTYTKTTQYWPVARYTADYYRAGGYRTIRYRR
jgi:hypothetical protein